MSDKTRVLALCDYVCSTGFATVSSNILQNIHGTGRYDIDVVGINYTGNPYDEKRFPGRVFPAMNIENMQMGDPYGRQKFLDMLGTGVYDVVFILQDTFVVQDMVPVIKQTYEALEKKFKTVFYFPFDCTPKKEWITDVVDAFDYPVAYTRYGKQLIADVDPKIAERTEVIYHGTNTTDFHYVEDREDIAKFRKAYFAGVADGKFLLSNINRNQPRKDVMRNLMVLAELKKRGRDNILLYLHMAHDDVGGNILVMADHFGLKVGQDFLLPSPRVFEPNSGIPIDALNYIYNASDAVITTTLGEGWGLSITEAMATKTPVIAPKNTSMVEMLENNRGLLAESGNTPSMWIMKEQDNERLRPLVDVEDAASKVELLLDGVLSPDVEAAHAWAIGHSWESVTKDWIRIFDTAAEAAKVVPRAERRRQEKAAKKANRGTTRV